MNPFQPFQMNMQNQFMNVNNTQAIEQIIQPFKEKIKKLEEELMKKDIEIANLKYTIFQMNMNMMPNYPNINPMFPNGNQMNMNMNMFGNNVMMSSSIPKETKKKKKIKRLNLKFNNLKNDIIIQCLNKDIMEDVIEKYCLKADIRNKEEYKFIVNGNKVKMHLTIDKNGINNKDQIIYVQKKDRNEYIEEKNEKNIMEDKNDDNDYEYYEDESEDEENNQIYRDIPIDNVKILGEKIILIFNKEGNDVSIEIGMNNIFNDAVIKYGAKKKLSFSKIKNDYKFLFNSCMLDIENKKTLKDLRFKNEDKIDVIICSQIIGA